jgi:transcriptional regulator with XRE-family HTH domain
MTTFAKRLRELRDKSGLTQEALARTSGLSLGNIRNYEQGVRQPRWQGIFKLAAALGVDCRVFAECVGAEREDEKPKKRNRK